MAVKKKKKKIRIDNILNAILYLSSFVALVGIIIVLINLIINKNEEISEKKKDIKIEIEDIYKKDNNIIVKINHDGECSMDNANWIKSTDKKCEFINTFILDKMYFRIDSNSSSYEKNIGADFSTIEKFIVNKDKLYLAVNGEEKIDYGIVINGRMNKKVVFTSLDEDIATVSTEGIVTGIRNGETKINVKLDDKEFNVDVIVSNLIVPMPEEYDFDKDELTCDIYDKEENDLLDDILKDRVTSAGYKTRAGAVAAARFIGLEFPYKINYFSENGRYPGVDGEGRYYHEGLYLNKSRYETLTNSSHGPGVWGCYIYSEPAEKEIRNGFDCSGFISWVLKNGGFSPGDIGAGISPGVDDLTDLGTLVKLDEAIAHKKLKVGDLLSGDGVPDIVPINGGHIAILVGMKEDSYYVAEELWWGTGYVGAVIRNYSTKDLLRYFYWQIDMDEFYGEDGNLTNYWIN